MCVYYQYIRRGYGRGDVVVVDATVVVAVIVIVVVTATSQPPADQARAVPVLRASSAALEVRRLRRAQAFRKTKCIQNLTW